MENNGRLETMLSVAGEMAASDLFISPISPVSVAVDGILTPLDRFGTLSPNDTTRLLTPVIPERKAKDLSKYGDTDFGKAVGDIRFRVNVFRQRNGLAAVFRRVSCDVPTLASLGLPPVMKYLSSLDRGLVLVVGPTGSGKSTTLAAMLREAMATRKGHVVTIEDPVEYVHTETGGCVLNQREIGTDCVSFQRGLRAALRQAPNIILLGEMRDAETALTAMQAAETGHLVLSTLHTGRATEAPSRLVDLFPEMERGAVAASLAACLEGVVAQRLLPGMDGGRVAACEVMLGVPAVKAQVRAQKFEQLANSVQTGGAAGMITMEKAIEGLRAKGLVA